MTNKDALLVRFAQNTEYLVGILKENTCVGCPARKQCDGEENGKSCWQCSRTLREWLDTSIGGEADNKPARLDEPVKVTLVKPAKAAKPDALDHEMVSSLKRKAITKLGRELVQSSKGKQLAELLKENYGTHLVNGLKDEQLEEAYEKMLELQEE